MSNAEAAVATVRGTVRAVNAISNKAKEVVGQRLTILTEPNGGFLDLTVWHDVMPVDQAGALRGCQIEAVGGFGVYVSDRGVGFTRCVARDVVMLAEPATV